MNVVGAAELQRFVGCVAIVTGSAQGIGAACVERFAREGARVVVCDVNEAQGKELTARLVKEGHTATFVAVDVRHRQDVDRLMSETTDRFGRLDILVNNAGVHETRFTDSAASTELTEEVWDRVMQTNLRGPWLCSKAAVPLLRRSGGGVIINATSIGGMLGYPMGSAYGPSKAGLIQLTRVMALELAPFGIRVVCYAPGTTDTAMVSRYLSSPNAAELLGTRLFRRFTRPDEVAGLVAFLASDEAAMMTGNCVVMDAGATAWRGIHEADTPLDG